MFEEKNKLKSTNKWAFMKSAFESFVERQLIEIIFHWKRATHWLLRCHKSQSTALAWQSYGLNSGRDQNGESFAFAYWTGGKLLVYFSVFLSTLSISTTSPSSFFLTYLFSQKQLLDKGF